MSGIAGFWYTDAPPPPGLLERMTSTVAHRGPDGIRHWVSPDGRVGLAHLAFWTTPEAVHEQQPLADETGRCVLTLDGRVDNREDLRRELVGRGAVLRDDTDAELVLKSYLVWGEDSTRRILGDFAYAIWDEHERRLFCARDFLGIRPLFYFHDGRKLLVGSQAKQLFADPAVPLAPDEVTAGVLLATTAAWDPERTLFRGVRRLRPAHSLLFGGGATRPRRYWTPEAATPSASQDHTENFRHLFREAVRCRLRHHGRVGADLSGGLDSSSVVAMSWALIREGAVEDPGFETFSWIFPGHRCDESRFIGEVLRWSGLTDRAHLVDSIEESARHDYVADVRRDWEVPPFPSDAFADTIRPLARERGFRISLTGCGGDEWFTGSRYQLADLLRERRFRTFLERLRGEEWSAAWHYALRPLLASALPAWPKRVLRHLKGPSTLIDPSFARRIRLASRAPVGLDSTALPWAKRSRLFHCQYYVDIYELIERCGAACGVEDRHPLHDRRLVELSLAIPEEECWSEGESKRILRRALAELLPPAVRHRRDKADFSISAVLALETPRAERDFSSLALEDLGWVQKGELRRRREEILRQHRAGSHKFEVGLWVLWLAYGLELWYREVFLGWEPHARAACDGWVGRV